MTEAGAHFAGRKGRAWRVATSIAAPIMLTCAYIVLLLTSDVDLVGALWEGVAFVLVIGFWLGFRMLTHRGALHRAIAVGDPDRILELAKLPLHRAVAYELRGDWPSLVRTLDAARPASVSDQVIAAALRIHALCATGEVARARELLDKEIEPRAKLLDRRLHSTAHDRAQLARARVLKGEGKRAEADVVLERVIDDMRADATAREAARQLRSGQSS